MGTVQSMMPGIVRMNTEKYTRAYIESLEEQIRLYKEQNRILLEYVEDSKAARQQLYQQLELYREREKLALLREQRDYQRLMELERKLAVSAPAPSPALQAPAPAIHESPATLEVEVREAIILTEAAPAIEDDIDVEIDYEDEETKTLIDLAIHGKGATSEELPEDIIPPKPTAEALHLPAQQVPSSARPSAPVAAAQASSFETSKPMTEAPLSVSEAPPISTMPEAPQATPSTNQTQAAIEPSATEKQAMITEWFNAGLAASERKEYLTAVAYFQKVAELLPEAAPSFLNLAILHFRLNQLEAARQYAQQAVALGSEPAQRILQKIHSALQA